MRKIFIIILICISLTGYSQVINISCPTNVQKLIDTTNANFDYLDTQIGLKANQTALEDTAASLRTLINAKLDTNATANNSDSLGGVAASEYLLNADSIYFQEIVADTSTINNNLNVKYLEGVDTSAVISLPNGNISSAPIVNFDDISININDVIYSDTTLRTTVNVVYSIDSTYVTDKNYNWLYTLGK